MTLHLSTNHPYQLKQCSMADLSTPDVFEMFTVDSRYKILLLLNKLFCLLAILTKFESVISKPVPWLYQMYTIHYWRVYYILINRLHITHDFPLRRNDMMVARLLICNHCVLIFVHSAPGLVRDDQQIRQNHLLL